MGGKSPRREKWSDQAETERQKETHAAETGRRDEEVNDTGTMKGCTAVMLQSEIWRTEHQLKGDYLIRRCIHYLHSSYANQYLHIKSWSIDSEKWCLSTNHYHQICSSPRVSRRVLVLLSSWFWIWNNWYKLNWIELCASCWMTDRRRCVAHRGAFSSDRSLRGLPRQNQSSVYLPETWLQINANVALSSRCTDRSLFAEKCTIWIWKRSRVVFTTSSA